MYEELDISRDMITMVFVPLQVIDISSQVKEFDNFKVDEAFLINWEKENGKIPLDSAVLFRTNMTQKQFNGFLDGALQYLLEKRSIIALGHD